MRSGEHSFDARGGAAPDALQSVADSFLYDEEDRVAALALAQRLHVSVPAVDVAYAGVFLAYGPSVTEFHRRSACYVKLILERLDGHEPHCRPRHRLANRFRISSVGLPGFSTCRTPRCRPGKEAISQKMAASATAEATCGPPPGRSHQHREPEKRSWPSRGRSW
jgi:hypothetical protein